MIRKISMIFILFLITGSVFGQFYKFGILFDPTITWLRSDVKDVTRDKARMGFDLGMSVDRHFTDNYAFATCISLFNMGGTLKYDKGITLHTKGEKEIIEAEKTVKYKVQYVKIPVAMKFKSQMIGRFIYSVNLGFDPMIKVSARANFHDLKNINVNKEVKFLNLGWHFGGGAQYSLGEDFSLFGGLSIMNTFMDMTKPSHDKITSANLAVRIGVMF